MNPKAQARAQGAGPEGPPHHGPELLSAWFRHGRGSGVVFLLVLAVATVVTVLRRPLYEADASVLVKYGREYVYRPEVGEQRAVIALTPEEILNSEEQIITSDELVRLVVKTVGPARLFPGFLGVQPSVDQAAREFHRKLTAEAVPRSSVLRVVFRHPDPAIAAEALHVLVDAYKQRHLEVFSDATLEFVEKQTRVFEERLRDSERALEAFRQAHGVFNYAEQMTLLLRRRAELDAVHQQSTVELAETQRRAEALDAALERPRPTMRTPPLSASEAIQTDLLRLEAEAAARTARLAELSTLRAAVERQIRGLDRAQRELSALTRETAERERLYTAQRIRFEEMRSTWEMAEQKLSNIAIIDRGAVPSTPATSRLFRFAIGLALALLSALVYPFLAEHLSQGMPTPDAVERRLGVAVLASVQELRRAELPAPPASSQVREVP